MCACMLGLFASLWEACTSPYATMQVLIPAGAAAASMPACHHLLPSAAPPSWDRFGHGSHHGHGDKATGHHTTGQHTTTTQNVAVPVDNVRIVDRV